MRLEARGSVAARSMAGARAVFRLPPCPQLTTHWPAAPAGPATARHVGEVAAQLQVSVLQFCWAVQVWTLLSCCRVPCWGVPAIETSATSVRLPAPVSSAELMNSSLFCE